MNNLNAVPRDFGFAHAPLTKVLFAATVICSVLAGVDPNVDDGFLRWLSPFAFTSLNEFIFGVILLFHFSRIAERLMGTAKFFIYVLISLIFCESTTYALLTASDVSEDRMWGPYGIIFSLFAVFHNEVPSIPRETSLNVFPLSQKSLLYIWTCYLWFWGGALAKRYGVLGLVVGLVLTSRNLGGFASTK